MPNIFQLIQNNQKIKANTAYLTKINVIYNKFPQNSFQKSLLQWYTFIVFQYELKKIVKIFNAKYFPAHPK